MKLSYDTAVFPQSGEIIRHDEEKKAKPSTVVHATLQRYSQKMQELLDSNLMTEKEATAIKAGKHILWCTDAREELPIRLATTGLASATPITSVQLFAHNVQKYSSRPALHYKPEDVPNSPWVTFTWRDYWDQCCQVGKALISLGLNPKDRIGVMGFNSPFWAFSHFGAIFSGCIPCAIYPSSTPSLVRSLAVLAEMHVIVTDTLANTDKILSIKDGLPNLKLIVQYSNNIPSEYAAKKVVSFRQFSIIGINITDSELSKRMDAQNPGDCCSIIFTSGTTGISKGVMLSHDNVTWTAWTFTKFIEMKDTHRIVSFLPLSHIAAQVVDLYIPLCVGLQVFFARSDALQGSLIKTLLEVHPSFLLGVPRVWEKVEQAVRLAGSKTNPLLSKFKQWGRDTISDGLMSMLNGKKTTYSFSVARLLLIKAVRKALGLEECNALATCAAPMSLDTQKFFMSIGMPICEIYGLSETTGPQTSCAPGPNWFKLGSIGRLMGGCEVTVMNPSVTGRGELCFRGRNVFMGYLKNDQATMNAIDPNGFFHSGDEGYIDSDGFVFITGRLKELIITAGGENIAPVGIENELKKHLPIISNCQVIGDGKKFISILLCLKTVVTNNYPSSELDPETVKLLESNGSSSKTIFEAIQDPVVHRIIDEGIKHANTFAPSRAHYIRKWRILPQDFTERGGELTPTLKLRRNIVISKYTDLIFEIYKEAENDIPTTHSKL